MMRHNLKEKKISQKGFTLQEMVIVTAIVTVLSISVYLIFVNSRKIFTLQNYSAIAENQALKASLVMQREIREARAPEGLDLQAIEEANSQSIIFYADITDEPTNNREEKIQYLLYNGKLLRGIAYWNTETSSYNPLPNLTQHVPGAANEKVIAEFIINGTNPVFYYYDADYTGSQAPMGYPINLGSIKVIRAYLEIDVNPNQSPESYIHETTIQLRNPNV